MSDDDSYKQPNVDRPSRFRRYLIGLPITLAIYLILIFLYLYPHRPVDLVGWLILVFFGVPASALMEWIGAYFFSQQMGTTISPEKFSAKRIVVAFLGFLFLIGASVLFWLAFGLFIRIHFT